MKKRIEDYHSIQFVNLTPIQLLGSSAIMTSKSHIFQQVKTQHNLSDSLDDIYDSLSLKRFVCKISRSHHS